VVDQPDDGDFDILAATGQKVARFGDEFAEF
jgi:hypothetical protein